MNIRSWIVVRALACSVLAAAYALVIAPVHAEVSRVDITQRTDLFNGRAYGAAGAYEWVQGRAHFTLDPANARNKAVVDIELAPKNTQGLVEFSADMVILRPKDAAKANGVVVFDVINRGRYTILEYLNRGNRTAKELSEEFVGDDFLLKQGVTIVFLGWQQDLPDGMGLLRMSGPVIEGLGSLIHGDAVVTARVNEISLGDRLSIPYAVADLKSTDAVLTVAASRSAPAQVVPRDQWAFARLRDGALVDDPLRIHLKSGFEPGAFYRFVYPTRGSQLAGLSLAGIRDLISWMRYDASALVKATHAYAFGISQSGRFLRQFLYEGFNADLAGRPVFDAMMVHIAGGSRRGFNERFAQPSRNLVSRVFPFTDVEQTDNETGERGGILTRARAEKVVPKIFYTHSSWEYWGSAASTVQTTVDGKAEIQLADTSRAYLLASTQHVPVAFPPRSVPALRGQLLPNPLDYRPVLRALYVALDQWTRAGTAPPPSRYPKLADRDLVARAQLNVKGYGTIKMPASPQIAMRLDSGERTPGVPTIVPPKVGKPYAIFVPQVDDDGNDIGGIRAAELAVPLATYMGWNLRHPSIGAPGDLVQLGGSYLPFALTRDAREKNGDTRLSIAERYTSREDFLGRVEKASRALVAQRLMMTDDVAHVMKRADDHWNHVHIDPAK
ncbi:MAG: alpha/beta hydrolase domain-containing protein [Burkholderiales bacterium]